MQTNPAVEENKTLNGPLVREISPVEKEKVYGGNDLVKSQVLSSHVISADSLDSFKARLKSHLFDIVWHWILSPRAPDSGFILWKRAR